MRKNLMMMLMALGSCIPMMAAKNSPQPEINAEFPGGKCTLYRLTLTDKKGTPYSISKPEAYLSKKAIDRRKKQGLAIDSTDLPINPTYLKGIEKVGVQIKSKSKWNNTVVVRVTDDAIVQKLLELSYVKSALKVWASPESVEEQTRSVFNQELEPKAGTPEDDYGAAYLNIDMVNGRKLHEMGFKGNGITIAVFDGGFMNVDRLPMMKDIKILGSKDFNAFPVETIFAEEDHGTKVLSTIAMNLKGFFVGTAPEASFWLMRTEDNATETLVEEDYWAAAAEFADSIGVDIITSSLGYQDFDEHEMDHTYAELDGSHALISCTASMLSKKGIIHVNSAGNEGNDLWKKIGFPADAHDILAVGALKPNKKNANFSSVGPSQDGRVKPDIMSLGSPAAVVSGRGKINNDMGTSFAAPIIAGMVASLWQSAPNKTAHEVMDAIRRSGDTADVPNNVFGYGIPDFEKAYQLLH